MQTRRTNLSTNKSSLFAGQTIAHFCSKNKEGMKNENRLIFVSLKDDFSQTICPSRRKRRRQYDINSSQTGKCQTICPSSNVKTAIVRVRLSFVQSRQKRSVGISSNLSLDLCQLRILHVTRGFDQPCFQNRNCGGTRRKFGHQLCDRGKVVFCYRGGTVNPKMQ